MDINYQPNENLSLYGTLGLQDAEYKNIPQIGLQQQADCAASPINAGGGEGIITPDCNIADPVRTPAFTATVGASYDFPIGNSWNLTPSVNVRFVDDQQVGVSNNLGSFDDGYTLVNGGIALSDDDGKWRATLECKNCFDEAYSVSLLAGTVYSNEPVRWHAGLRRNF